MPPSDWLYEKIKRLNLIVTEGYPPQEAGGLRTDHLICIPNFKASGTSTQAKTGCPNKLGRSIFSLHDT